MYSQTVSQHPIKTHGRGEVYLHSLTTSALDRCEWSASCRYRFTSGKQPLVPTTQPTAWLL